MNTLEETGEKVEGTSCASCGVPVVQFAGSTPLCGPCRTQFIAYPIPLWIKIFGGVLLCILLFSLVTLPENIQTGIHLKRGMKAAEARNFLSAEKEFSKVEKEEPEYTEAKCRLLIASFYNNDFPVFFKTSDALQNKKIEDDQLFAEMQGLINRAVTYLPKDSFYSIMEKYKMQTDSIPVPVYKTYLSVNRDDKFALSRFANVLFDQKQYNEAEVLLDELLAKEPFYYGALVLKTSLKREEGQLDSSYYFIDRLLSINRQDVFALSSKVRTLLKQKKDAEALALAKNTVPLDGKDAYALGSLALAYHYNNDGQARDAVLEKVGKDTTAAGIFAYVKDVINGKENFRN